MAHTHGMQLVVDFSGVADATTAQQISVLSRKDLDHAPHLTERLPELTTAKGRTKGEAEVVLTIFDAAGNEVDAVAYSVRAVRYLDVLDPKTGRLCGGPRYIGAHEPDIRVLRLPTPTDCWLTFHRTEVVEMRGVLEIDRRLLKLYDAAPWLDRKRPDFRDPDTRDAQVTPLPRAITVAWSSTREGPESDPRRDALSHHGGRILGKRRLDNHGNRPGKRFNIVITGDGFQNDEVQRQRFNDRVARLYRGLSRMEPFRSVWGLIDWYVVETASKDAGIRKCGKTKRGLKTFYQTEGHFGSSAAPSWFIGAKGQGLKRILDTASWATGDRPVGIVIVIANTMFYGGHASSSPDQRIAYVTAAGKQTVKYFTRCVAHECAHVIGRLGDEYMRLREGRLGQANPNAPNIAALDKVSVSVRRRLLERAPELLNHSSVSLPPPPEDSIWWRRLARHGELSKDGRVFRAVHVCGDYIDVHSSRPLLNRRAPNRSLGVFWGTQVAVDHIADLKHAYRDLLGMPRNGATGGKKLTAVWQRLGLPSDEGAEGDEWTEPRGAIYFRPMGECRMRKLTYPFCRVCSHILKNAIRDMCGKRIKQPYPRAT